LWLTLVGSLQQALQLPAIVGKAFFLHRIYMTAVILLVRTRTSESNAFPSDPTLTIIFLSQLQDEHPAALDDAEV
jgi:hypothetical protein